MPDIAPTNRKRGRPLGSRTRPQFQRQPAVAGAKSVERQKQSLSQSAAPSPVTGTGAASVDADMVAAEMAPDMPPTNAEASRPFTGFGGKYGLLKTNIVTSYAGIGAMLGGPMSADGMLFMASAESIADAWISWGKADPRYMRIVTLMWGSPFMTLFVAHAPLVGGIMANHGVSMGQLLVPMNMRRLGDIAALRKNVIDTRQGGQPPASSVHASEPAPLPYQPAGPFAPTEAAPPPPPPDEGVRLYPDEGLPAEVDVQLREISRKQGIPYQELHDQAMLQLAQMRLAQNGKVASQAAGLGMPVMKPE